MGGRKNDFRLLVSCVIGIVAFFLILIPFMRLYKMMGINEVKNARGIFELAPIAIGLMLASRVGRVIYFKSLKGNVSQKGEILFLACLSGIAAAGFFWVVLDVTLRCIVNGFIHNKIAIGALYTVYGVLGAGGTIGIVWSMKLWYEFRIRQLKTSRG